jgi:hypothetical protein
MPGGGRRERERENKEKTFFLDFQNDESPNTSNGLSRVLVVHSQFYSLINHASYI